MATIISPRLHDATATRTVAKKGNTPPFHGLRPEPADNACRRHGLQGLQGLPRKRTRMQQEEPEAVTKPLALNNALPETRDNRRSANSMPLKAGTYGPNAALSGRGPTTYQETWKHLPAVRLNA